MLIDLDELQRKYGLDVDYVLHVGAHQAEEADAYERLANGVIWVEANPALYQALTARRDLRGRFHYFVGCAVTDVDRGTVDFNIANNGQSSSILDLGTHKTEHPDVVYTDKITVETRTIDSLSREIDMGGVNFINLDIQGAELLALQGAEGVLAHVDYIYTEVNRRKLYLDCALVEDIDRFLAARGFRRVETEWSVHQWGDAFYVR